MLLRFPEWLACRCRPRRWRFELTARFGNLKMESFNNLYPKTVLSFRFLSLLLFGKDAENKRAFFLRLECARNDYVISGIKEETLGHFSRVTEIWAPDRTMRAEPSHIKRFLLHVFACEFINDKSDCLKLSKLDIFEYFYQKILVVAPSVSISLNERDNRCAFCFVILVHVHKSHRKLWIVRKTRSAGHVVCATSRADISSLNFR